MIEENKNVQILSIEGKDLITKDYKVNDNTFYKGSFDDSIEIDKLKDISKKIIKYNVKTKRLYSNDIITVTFKYACNENIKNDKTKELELKLKELRKSENNNSLLIEDIEFELMREKQTMTRKNIRNYLYKYGFDININGEYEHFVRYKRSGGSARVGKCLFINDKFYKKMIDWSFAGIPHKENQPMDCASMESYISLPTSSCVDRFELLPENILLIEDKESIFTDTVMATRLINEVKDEEGNTIDGDLDTNVEETEIHNKIWDGEALLDKSIFINNGYSGKAILQIRNRMYKGIGVNTDIQKFFKDNNITSVQQLNGKTIATDVSQIKLITTPSSIKYLKYGTFEKWLKQIVPIWGICKYEKPQKHFDGMVQTHYQLLNTLGMSKDKMKDFLEDTINYVNLLKNDISVFKYHLGIGQALPSEDGEYLTLPTYISTSSQFVHEMLKRNDDFINTKMGKSFRNDLIKSYINNIRHGHVLVQGNYSVVVDAPYEMLLESVGKWDGVSSLIKQNECVCSKFRVDEEIVASRSPQPTMCNMTVFKNNKYNELDSYFNTQSQEVVYISAIGWNIFELESSMDVDGDSMLLTNNKYIVESAKRLNETICIDGKEIKRFLVSTDFTPKSSIKRKYNWRDLADTDIKCSSNKIGEIINLAQMLNSVYWDKKSKGVNEKELFNLYKDICQLNILSCIEIDRCKKISPVNAQKELSKIRGKGYLGKGTIIRNKQKKTVGIRPYFFKFLDGGKNYKFKKFNTGMDYLEEIIDKELKYKDREEYIPFYELLVDQKCTSGKKLDKINKIVQYVTKYNDEQKNIWSQNIDNRYELHRKSYEDLLNKVQKISLDSEILYTILYRIGQSEFNDNYKIYKNIGRKILNVLCDYNKKMLLKNIKIKNEETEILIDDENGEIKLYDKKCLKIKQKGDF